MVYIGLNLREITDFQTVKKLSCWTRVEISPECVKDLLTQGFVSCCLTEHLIILRLVRSRFGIEIPVASYPMRYRLGRGDKVVVVYVFNIESRPVGEGYSLDQLRKARITFLLYDLAKLS